MTLLTDLLGTVAPIGATGVPGASGAIGATGISALAISNVQIADSSYNVLDDTAANTTGGYLVLTGTGFTSNCVVIVGSTNAISTAYINTTSLRAQVGAFTAATYNLYVVDGNTGSTAIKVNGLTTSAFPAWSTGATLSNQNSGTAFGINVSATSDSSITYANTTVLPTGTTLLSNGYFYGTVTIGSQTTYNFDIDAKDAENQDATRTFSLTVTLVPPTKLWSWGLNNQGQLGLNDTNSRMSPTQIGAITNWSLVSDGGYNGMAVKNDGTLWAWGWNNNGQLGQNDRVNKSSPAQIGALTNWLKVVSTYNSSFAVKTDGTLWGWGLNNAGQLGQNDQIYRSSPVQIGAGTTWSRGFGSFRSAFFFKTDGTLWGWGSNSFGQLATGNNIPKSSPTQIGSGYTWLAGSCGYASLLAVRSDGTLWTSGFNSYGTLGLNDITQRLSLTQIGSGTTWLSVTGVYQTIATKTDGTLWSWGYNVGGLLGQNTATGNSSSPVQVGAGTTWSQVSAGYSTIAAIKTDGTLWVWGGPNQYGQLGLNDFVARSSPTQVGTNTNWTQISASFYYGFQAITTN